MSVSDETLGRIQRRYPRIAAKIFRNLRTILSDRATYYQTARNIA